MASIDTKNLKAYEDDYLKKFNTINTLKFHESEREEQDGTPKGPYDQGAFSPQNFSTLAPPSRQRGDGQISVTKIRTIQNPSQALSPPVINPMSQIKSPLEKVLSRKSGGFGRSTQITGSQNST